MTGDASTHPSQHFAALVWLVLASLSCVALEELGSYSEQPTPTGDASAPFAPAPAAGPGAAVPAAVSAQYVSEELPENLEPGPPGLDASVSAAPERDARPPASGGMPGLELDAAAACAGVSLQGICWYLGAFGESCNEACEAHGGYRDAATSYVGTRAQGGSPEECGVLLQALGIQGSVREGARDDGLGLGCQLLGSDADPWWQESPRFDPDDELGRARLVCGCSR